MKFSDKQAVLVHMDGFGEVETIYDANRTIGMKWME
jgi:hypothetical protein